MALLPAPCKQLHQSSGSTCARQRQRRCPCAHTPPAHGSRQQAAAAFQGQAFTTAAAAPQPPQPRPNGAALQVDHLTFHPPGSETPLLNDISMKLPANGLNLIIGRSGSGKTLLLQLLAGLSEQTSGEVLIGPPGGAAALPAAAGAGGSSLEERMQRVGLVFQFPERHFLGETVASELSFAWPPSMQVRFEMSNRAQTVLAAVGLSHVPLHLPPYALSGGQQRRLALAVQLVRQPSLLLLDEPLAGLDWQSRAEVVALLAELKQHCTLLVVSHDLREVAPLVDRAWEMKPGGMLCDAEWPPPDLGKAWRRQEP